VAGLRARLPAHAGVQGGREAGPGRLPFSFLFFSFYSKGFKPNFQHLYKPKFNLLILGYFKNCFLYFFLETKNIFLITHF